MPTRPKREAVDFSAYPDLVVIYLGMRVNVLRGIGTVLGFGPKISGAVAAQPDGLLLHENLFYSLRHVGMRQYWRDFDSLEAWSRSEPHRIWWQNFLRDRGRTGFRHETYFLRGGVKAIIYRYASGGPWPLRSPEGGYRNHVFGAQTRGPAGPLGRNGSHSGKRTVPLSAVSAPLSQPCASWSGGLKRPPEYCSQ
jgi:hypothetical protein